METLKTNSHAVPEGFATADEVATTRGRSRLFAAAAAILCSSATIGAVLLLFHLASADPWLLPSASLLEAQAKCDALAVPHERGTCARAAIERAKASAAAPRQVAQR